MRIEISSGELYIGNALEELRNLPGDSVDCVITSPPYYMLRQYGRGEETVCVWDGDPECEHEWEDGGIYRMRGNNDGKWKGSNDNAHLKLGSFCLKCGAWRGELGHEPDPDLFVSHLADIFDEVRRVLKPTGNLFLNIGDTYAGGGGTTGGHAQSWEKSARHRPNHKGLQKILGVKEWIKRKQLLLIPYRLAIELQMRGWIVRDMIIWAKSVSVVGKTGDIIEQFGNGLPESTKDRLTKSYEIIIHAVKSEKYYFDKPKTRMKAESLERLLRGVSESHKYARNPEYGGGEGLNRPRPNVRKQYEGKFASGEIDPESVGSMRARLTRAGRNGDSTVFELNGASYGRNVIQVNTEPFPDAHFAVMPTKLVRFLMKAGCPKGGTVLDPFMGAGTVALVAEEMGMKWIGVEINPQYTELIRKRLKTVQRVLFR